MQGEFLEAISGASRAALERCSSTRSWRQGATLFREGERATQVFIVTEGLVKVSMCTAAGVEIGLALKGPGSLLGELASIDQEARSATASAVRPVRAMVIGTDDFRALLAAHADIAFTVLEHTVANLRGTSRRQAEFGGSDATARLARVLVELAGTYGTPSPGGIEVRLLSQDELASFCSASREAIARGLRILREHGLLETGRKVVRIRDLDALAGWVGPDSGS